MNLTYTTTSISRRERFTVEMEQERDFARVAVSTKVIDLDAGA